MRTETKYLESRGIYKKGIRSVARQIAIDRKLDVGTSSPEPHSNMTLVEFTHQHKKSPSPRSSSFCGASSK
jgi:hypothetical protein